MNTYRRIIEQINYLAFLVLLCAMPYAFPFIRFFGLVWAVSWLFELRFLKRENICLSKPRLFVAIGFTVWVLWNIISVLWAGNKSLAGLTIERDIYLLIVPIMMIFGVNEQYNWQQCIKLLTISAAISVGVYLFTNYWMLNIDYAHNKHISTRVDIDWANLKDFTLTMKHRLHYTTLFCLAIIGINTLFVQRLTNIKQTIGYGLGLAWFLLATYWTDSRAAIINLGLIAILTALWIWTRYAPRTVRQKVIAALIVAVLIVGGLAAVYKFHPRNANISLELFRNLPEGTTPHCEPRLAIWSAALENPGDYSLYGVGVGNSYDYIQAKYIAHGWKAYYTYHYSTHSQLLATWIELGLAAMILWILFWLAIPFFFRGKERYWTACISAVVLVNMSTDLFLGGVEGIVFVIVAFILLDVLSKEPK